MKLAPLTAGLALSAILGWMNVLASEDAVEKSSQPNRTQLVATRSGLDTEITALRDSLAEGLRREVAALPDQSERAVFAAVLAYKERRMEDYVRIEALCLWMSDLQFVHEGELRRINGQLDPGESERLAEVTSKALGKERATEIWEQARRIVEEQLFQDQLAAAMRGHE